MSDNPHNDTTLLAQIIGLDALIRLLIKKGVITDKEFTDAIKETTDKMAREAARGNR